MLIATIRLVLELALEFELHGGRTLSDRVFRAEFRTPFRTLSS